MDRMKTAPSSETVREAHDLARYQFILTELELACTFCEVALAAADPQKARRNAVNAQHAYAEALRFFEDASLNSEMYREVQSRIDRLETLLKKLPQTLSRA